MTLHASNQSSIHDLQEIDLSGRKYGKNKGTRGKVKYSRRHARKCRKKTRSPVFGVHNKVHLDNPT